MASFTRTRSAFSARPDWQREGWSVSDTLVFLVGLGSALTFHFIGEILVAELLLVLCLPFLYLLHSRAAVRAGVFPIYVLLGAWLIGQVMTDVYRESATRDWMRGDAQIIFLGMNLFALMLLIGRDDRSKMIFWTGYALSALLAARFQPSEFTYTDPWKFGYAEGVILLVVLVSCYFYMRGNYLVVTILLCGIAAVNLLMNFRSKVLFLLVTLAMVVPIIPERIGRLRLLPRKGTTARVLVSVLFMVIAGSVAANLVRLATARGLVGEEAQIKNREQSNVSLGILLGGRPEILVSSRAVIESPLLGYGSWARSWKYEEMLNDILARRGGDVNFAYAESLDEPYIPSHSHLMGAWVNAGILGAIFWAYILWLSIKAFLRVAKMLPPLAPLYTYLLASMTWDILFSPFGNTRRIAEAIVILIILDTRVAGAVQASVVRRGYGRGWRRMPPRERAAMPSGT